MLLSSILCSWIQLTERNKIWKFEENRLRKLNDTQSLKTMISNSLFSSSRLIFSLKTMILRAEYHYSFEIENLYHLLCAFSFYFLTKSIFFENMIMNSTRSYWGNFYHLLCAFSFYFLTNSIFFENMITDSIRSYWENLYHLLCAFSFYCSIFFENMHELNSLLLRKLLSFTMCFLIEFILFLDERIVIEKTSIIYYLLSRWAHCHWENLYYLLCAFSFYFLTSSIFFENTIMNSICSYWKHLYYLLCAFSSNCVLRRVHCHWENLYYLVSAFSVIDVWNLTLTLIMIDVKSFLETLRKSLLFSRCFLIIFLDKRIEKTSII